MLMIKTVWNVLVLGVALAYFGVLAQCTYFMGREAMTAHQQGLVSLSKLTHALTGK